jgi:hypothetical protein
MADKESKLPAEAAQAAVDAFLKKAALTPVEPRSGPRGRLIFAMDATASRQPSWDRACQIQGEMFRATEALGGLEVQLIYYRGFGQCRATKWFTNPKDLVHYMTRVFCLGGHTQIAKVLRHAIKETKKRKVDALVFVGDCMEEEVDSLCHLAGELGLLGVPAFIFHEGGEPVAGRAFRQIARLTKGAYCPFDSSSAQQLRDLLSAVAVYAAGGRAALERHVEHSSGEVKLIASQLRTS